MKWSEISSSQRDVVIEKLKQKAETTSYPVTYELINDVENEIDLRIGKQLKKYLINFGYIGLGAIEFYGLNSKQQLKSNMVEETKYLHKYYPLSSKYIAFEYTGDGDYILVDSKDYVYSFSTEKNELNPMGMRLLDYVLMRIGF